MIEEPENSNNILFQPDLSKVKKHDNDDFNEVNHSKSILNKSSMMTYGKM